MLARKGFHTMGRYLSPVIWLLLLVALGFAVTSMPQATDPPPVAAPVPDTGAATDPPPVAAPVPITEAASQAEASKLADAPPVVAALAPDTDAASQAAASKPADPLPASASPVVKGELRVPPIRRVQPKTPKPASTVAAAKSGKSASAAPVKEAAQRRIACAKGQMLNRKTNTCVARAVQPAAKGNAKAP